MHENDRTFWIGPAHDQMCRIRIVGFREAFALNLEHESLPAFCVRAGGSVQLEQMPELFGYL